MKTLPMVTLVCADCASPGAAIVALRKTLTHITPAETLFFTDRDLKIEGINVVKLNDPIRSKREYSRFILKDLNQYIKTDFVLIIQADGYVIDADQWDDEFLNYDLIGAPWPYDHDRRIGNGGFSLRSRKLVTAVATDDLIDVLHPEDQSICIIYKFYLEEKYGITFAPEELAAKFSYELYEPTQKTFGFHGWHWLPYRETVVIKRTGAMGDVIQVEPVLEYFHKNGYRVVLDTLPQFYELFRDHYFPVQFISQLNPNIKAIEYNLDMSYEADPKRLHLDAYYDFCGVPKEERIIRAPRLKYEASGSRKLFKKYVVIHIDEREQASRNVYGIKWSKIVNSLKLKGYTVIQIGLNKHEDIDAIYMATITQDLLAYLIAGCDIFIGVDSGPSHIAVATGRKSIIFFGSVKPEYIHANFETIWPIYREGVCEKPFCWHDTIGTTGTKCYIDNEKPPCTNFEFKTESVFQALIQIINKNKIDGN